MSQATLTASAAHRAQPMNLNEPLTVDELEQRTVTSTTVAWGVIAGLPALGALAALFAGLPLFAALMAACFLASAGLTLRKAVTTFTGRALQLLVSARLAIILVVGALLFCVSGSAWTAVVSALLLWLAADRLLGRRALYDLWKTTKRQR